MNLELIKQIVNSEIMDDALKIRRILDILMNYKKSITIENKTQDETKLKD
jgi:hypothetical protein